MELNERKKALVARGLKLAKTGTVYHNLPIKRICADENVSHTMIFHYFKTAEAYKDAVIQMAVEQECLPVLAQALAARHPVARSAPKALKERAAASLLA